mmetsp:Transcript_3209/g.5704  ORF Transcript_3209/g.5704 Transcript_3209/m.5704 type:complete len:762 (-) Transcript_3209:12-2297(-)
MTILLPPASPSLPPEDFGLYTRGGELGHGAHGRVYECTKSGSKDTFAVKAMNLRGMRLSVNFSRELKKLRREVDILQKLPPHRNIVQMVDVFEETDWFLIVLEYVSGGDLFNTLVARPGLKPRLMEREASYVFWQLVDGLAFLHGQGILHRDLKLENVLIASVREEGHLLLYHVKITDFGLSKAVGDGLSEPQSVVGTRRYVAPEVLREGSYDFRVDLWSLGVMLYILLDGRYPHERPAHVEQDVLDRAVARLEASNRARTIVTGLLQLKPGDRMTLAELGSKTWTDGFEDTQLGPRLGTESTRNTQSLFGSEDLIPPSAPERDTSSPIEEASVVTVPSATGLAVEPMPKPTQTLMEPPEVPANKVSPKAEKDGSPKVKPAPKPINSPVTTLPEAQHQAGINLNHVIAAGADANDMQVHMVVPERFAGSVLGKGGEIVKQAAATAGCKVWMTAREGSSDRHVVMIGTYAACEHAQRFLHKHLSEEMDKQGQSVKDVTVMLLVRKDAAGVVIGKQGAGLESIHRESGARVHVLRDEVENQRPCTITGPLDIVLKAEKLVRDLEMTVQSSQSHADATGKRQDVGKPQTAVKRPRFDDAQSSLKFLIPSESAGSVIGKAGVGLKQIRSAHHVQIEVLRSDQASQWPNHRVVNLRGDLGSLQGAVEAVLGLVFPGTGEGQSLKVLVPTVQAGHVIGRRGSMLKAIHDECGCVAHVEREDVRGERVVTATGQLKQVSAAACMLVRILEHAVQLSAAPARHVFMHKS